MKKIIFITLLCAWGLALAQEDVKPLDSNPQIDSLDLTEENVIASDKAMSLTKDSPNSIRANEFSAYYTSGFTKFEQSGNNGATYDSENGSAPGILVNYHHWFKADRSRLLINAWKNQANFVEPSQIGDKKVSVDRTFASVSGQWFYGSDSASGWKFSTEGGLGFLSQKPKEFTNDVRYVPNFLMAGPLAGIGFQKNWPGNLRIRGRIIGMIPQTYKEYGKDSGNHDLSWYAMGSLFLDFHLNTRLSFSVGSIAEKEEHKFEGDGERGISSAKNSYMNYSFPVGVAYAF